MNDLDKTILVLGGGVGGVVTAIELKKKLEKRHRVVVVEREERHVFAPSLLWVMTGKRSAKSISRPLSHLRKKGIEVVRGEIERIDPERREVVVSGTTLAGDYVVVALGAELAPESIPGLEGAGHDFYSLEGAEGLRDALAGFRAGKLMVMTAAPAYKCPAAPYEAAMLLEHELKKRRVRDAVEIDLYAAEPGPMGVAGPEVSKAVRAMVEQKGVRYHPEHQVTSVDANARRITFANGVTAEYDLLAYVPPHRAPRVVRESGLVSPSGWVEVDRHALTTSFERVYAIGDVVTIPLKLGKPLPKAGVFAHGEAEVVAANIARDITGDGAASRYDGHGACFIEAGGGKAGFGKGDFYAEPVPEVRLYKVTRSWHAAKILFEKNWLLRWL